MFLIKLLRLLCGCVGFYAEGGFPERFINLCSLNGIPLWGVKTSGSRISACTTLDGYLRIHDSAVKSGMRLRHFSEKGMPFFVTRYRRRAGLLCGLGIFFAVIGMLSSMVWTIEISSNSKVTDEEILAVLEEAGLKPGIFKDSINAPEIRFYALSRLPDVTYLTVNLIGSSVQVEVTERIEQPDIPSDSTPCEIVSAVDGQLTVLEVYEGTKLHEVGDAVSAGETLAGGFVELSDGSVRFRHAEAYAVINTQIKIRGSSQSSIDTLVKTKTEKHTTLHLLRLNLPLFIKSEETPCATRSSYLTAGGTKLPFGYTQEIYTQYESRQLTLSASHRLLSAAEDYFIQKVDTLGGAEITDEKVTADGCEIAGEFSAEISAGIAREMMIE